MYTAIHLSKYIVTKCVADSHPISNLQLQKILYYIQKDYLSRNARAFSDEIEAWQFGPVVPEAYYRFCGFGSMPITLSYDGADIKPEDISHIDPIVEEKRKLNPWKMVEETHKAGGAWEKIYNNGAGDRTIIPIELIREMG